VIKVNLLRNRVQSQTQPTEASSTANSDQSREVVVKIACMLLFCAALMLYESQNKSSLTEEQRRLGAQVSVLEQENAARLEDVLKVKDVEIQAKELEDKLKILKLLSKLRLREVKTLDFMQSSIPEKVWLKQITYESDKVKVESGHLQFIGNAMTTEDLTEFVKRLEDSAYLMDVIVVKNQENVLTKGNSVREYLFTADVENKN
jgi:Tfp pilus assembly protein PilN